jgi:hypothetical protein
MNKFPRFARTGATGLAVAIMVAAALARQKDDKNAAKETKDQETRPKLTLKAQPMMAIAPARVVFTAELNGGANDAQDYYCPTVEWDWGDETRSETTADCEPYQAGKSEIKRRFTVEHQYKYGRNYRVIFRLKHGAKSIAAATVNIQVRPGLRDGG